ncbi:MAG: AAA family ATPase [Byssovorax sp.]
MATQRPRKQTSSSSSASRKRPGARRTSAETPGKAAGPILHVERFAHIGRVSIELGDLTLLVGPQAAGKSLLLQLLKLAIDGDAIARTIQDYGLVFADQRQFLERYLGADMGTAWKTGKTKVSWKGRPLDLASIIKKRSGKHAVYFVPAHRTLMVSEGYPPTFQQFRPETPFVVRHFSEEVRGILLKGFGDGALFPQTKRLKGKIREKIDDAIFHGAKLRDDTTRVQRQLVLDHGDTRLSYMTWTAGQREFIPLLLGLYYLLPAGQRPQRQGTSWVIIEEPEMGLHPKGIMAVMLLVLDLLSRGYRVVMSTHSPLVVDVVWAIKNLQSMRKHGAKWQDVLSLFDIEHVTKATAKGEAAMAERVLKKRYRVYSLDLDENNVAGSTDISSLDPGDANQTIAGWGGLTGFSGRIGEVVGKVVGRAHAAK